MINSTAIILAGGKSLRMGTNKLLLKINRETIIERVTNICRSNFAETILITNNPQEYEFLNIKMFADVYKNFGPLSGIHSGLINTKTKSNFFISADMPFITGEVIKHLFKVKSEKEIVLPSSENKVQPLCGIYSKSCIPIAEKLLRKAMSGGETDIKAKTKIKLFDLINAADTDIIKVDEEPFYHKELFLNMNNFDDYTYAKENFDKIMKGK